MPYAQTWTAGWQRKVGSNMVVEARYVGTRSLQSWQTYNYNEINIVENGFLERVPARAGEPAGQHRRRPRQRRSPTPAPAPGTSPLPIFLAHTSTAVGSPRRGNAANYTRHALDEHARSSDPWRSSTRRPANTGGQSRSIGNATLRSNALTAGLPANFFVANPDLIGGAEHHRQRRRDLLQLAAARAPQAPVARPPVPDATTSTASRTARSASRSATRASAAGHRHRGRRHARVQGQLGLRAAVRPGPPLRQRRRTVARSADRRLVVRRHRAHPERHDARLRQRPPRRHVDEGAAGLVQAALRRCRAASSTCCRRTSSTTPSGRSASARRRRPATAIRACRPGATSRRPTARTASRSPHERHQRLRRLRRAQPRRHRSDARPLRPQHEQADRRSRATRTSSSARSSSTPSTPRGSRPWHGGANNYRYSNPRHPAVCASTGNADISRTLRAARSSSPSA